MAVSFGSLAYIFIGRKFEKLDQRLIDVDFPLKLVKIPQTLFTILFFTFFSLSVLTLAYGFYSKSVLYYIFTSLCVGIVFVEIIFTNHHRKPWRILAEIFLLFLLISLSNQVIYPYGIGNPDDFYHIYTIMTPIINVGHIPEGYTYSYFPCHQILGAITCLILGTLPRMTYYCLGSFLMSLGILFVYIIGSKFLGTKFGLLSALLYACCDYIIYWAAHPVQMSYAYPLALMLVGVAIVSLSYKRSNVIRIVFIPLSLLMVFTHHYTAAIVLFIITTLCLFELLHLEGPKSRKKELVWFTLIYLIIMACQWIYYSYIFGGFIDIIDTYIDVFTTDISSSITSPTAYDALSAIVILPNEVGSCILLGLSTIGFLYCIYHRSEFFDMVLTIVLLFGALLGVGVLINVYYLLPNRIYVFLQQFALIFLASVAILWIIYNCKRETKKLATIVILIVGLSFFSSASTIAGFETSLFAKDQSYWKIYETPQERYFCAWGEKFIGDHSIASSGSLVCPVTNLSFVKYPIIETEQGYIPDPTAIMTSSESYFLFNKFDITTGTRYERITTTYQMGCSRWVKLSSSSGNSFNALSKIYDNTMISTYG